VDRPRRLDGGIVYLAHDVEEIGLRADAARANDAEDVAVRSADDGAGNVGVANVLLQHRTGRQKRDGVERPDLQGRVGGIVGPGQERPEDALQRPRKSENRIQDIYAADIAGEIDAVLHGDVLEHLGAVGMGDRVGAGHRHVHPDAHPAEGHLRTVLRLFHGEGAFQGQHQKGLAIGHPGQDRRLGFGHPPEDFSADAELDRLRVVRIDRVEKAKILTGGVTGRRRQTRLKGQSAVGVKGGKTVRIDRCAQGGEARLGGGSGRQGPKKNQHAQQAEKFTFHDLLSSSKRVAARASPHQTPRCKFHSANSGFSSS
jgi:hypothetical protein